MINPHAGIRKLIKELLNDNQDHGIHELVVLCDHLISPERASRSYINESGSQRTKAYRKAKPLEIRIARGRYSLIRQILYFNIRNGSYIKTGSGDNSTYRKSNAQQ